MEGNKPIKVFKAGAVKASIFENNVQHMDKVITNFRVLIDKVYKDSDGSWKSTNSFSAHNELPKAIVVLKKAYEYILFKDKPKDVYDECYS